MTERKAAGLILIAPGGAAAPWGFNLMDSPGAQIAGAIGMRDNTGPPAIGFGVIFALIGISLVATKGSEVIK